MVNTPYQLPQTMIWFLCHVRFSRSKDLTKLWIIKGLMNCWSLQIPVVNFVAMFSHWKENIILWESFTANTFQWVLKAFASLVKSYVLSRQTTFFQMTNIFMINARSLVQEFLSAPQIVCWLVGLIFLCLEKTWGTTKESLHCF